MESERINKIGGVMAISRKEAEKKAEAAKKKGYSVKIGADYLVIIAGNKRTEEEIK